MIFLMMIHLSQLGQGLNSIIRRGIAWKMIKTWMISLQESTNDLGLTGWDPPSILLICIVAFEPCLELKNSHSGILDVGYVYRSKIGRKISSILLGGPWRRGRLFPSGESNPTSNSIGLYPWLSPRHVEASLDADMISLLNLTPGIIRKCGIFLAKIPYIVQLSDIIVLSRATVHDFLDLEAVVDDDVSTDEEGDGSDGASYPTLFFFKLILITFNRWFYWWRSTCRNWVRDSTA